MTAKPPGSRCGVSPPGRAVEDPGGRATGGVAASLDHVRGILSEDEIRDLTRCLEDEIRERTGQMRAFVTTMTLSEQEERRRISRVLHEDLQQVLYGIQVRVMSLRAGVVDDEKLERWATQAQEWLSDAIRITEQLTIDFSPPTLREDGVAGALDWLAARMEQMHGLHVDIEPEQPPDVHLGALEQILYHALRELLLHMVEHAPTDRIRVSLELEEETLILRVRGFAPESSTREVLRDDDRLDARNRLALFGGRVDIESEPGSETQILLRVPLGEREA
jgi:two-component system, chemotaxis family, CheB/CheR fusion protein